MVDYTESHKVALIIVEQNKEIKKLRSLLDIAEELIDGCYGVVEIFGESPSQKKWSRDWRDKAKQLITKINEGGVKHG